MLAVKPKPLEWYRDRYKGERLFVCGNAPSLKEDYGKLSGEYVFGCNYIFLWDELPFPPTFYGITEPTDHAQRWQRRDELSLEAGIDHRFYLSRREIKDERAKRWTWLPKCPSGLMFNIGFKDEPPFATAGTTPLNIGVQFGSFMGFSEIYILGVELSSVKNHVYDLDDSHPEYAYLMSRVEFTPPRNNRLLHSFEMARKAMLKKGQSLVNCTPTGALHKEFGYIPLDDIL